jgi:transcription-repair coupling factor (superfamily II helicase)
MEISYKENDKLFVPITEVHRVTKYVGSENPHLTPLSGKLWEKKIQKVHEDIREIAE